MGSATKGGHMQATKRDEPYVLLAILEMGRTWCALRGTLIQAAIATALMRWKHHRHCLKALSLVLVIE
jgi:hypothetical protein